MSRYIDADKLKEECYKFANDVPRSAMAFAQGQINAAPTADVVEVVRCGNCKHRNPMGGEYVFKCLRDNLHHLRTDYCSYGERRDENEG